MKYIYQITSPSGKIYIGQSKMSVENKLKAYRDLEKNIKSNRKIANAIQKHGFNNMKFEIIEENSNWTNEELNAREIHWIAHYNTVNEGYNMTLGGEGVDSECARQNALRHHRTMSEDKKIQRSKNCSKGQKERYQKSPDSDITKHRKSQAHKGEYKIESPEGKVWVTNLGLEEFAKTFKNEIKISYWQLFNAYRKCYNTKPTIRKRKDSNNWKVIRLDKSNS
jgi:hypothetical protein